MQISIYYTGLTIAQSARMFISSVLPAMHMLLCYDVQRCYQQLLDLQPLLFENNEKDLTSKTIFDPGQELSQDLDNIAKLIHKALNDLQLDTPLVGTTKPNKMLDMKRPGSPDEPVNQQALLSLDAVCAAVADLEITLLKIDSAAATLDYHPRLAGHLAKYGFVTAKTESESKIILSLAKRASFGQDSHSWHSFDGRELGIPKASKIANFLPNIYNNIS